MLPNGVLTTEIRQQNKILLSLDDDNFKTETEDNLFRCEKCSCLLDDEAHSDLLRFVNTTNYFRMQHLCLFCFNPEHLNFIRYYENYMKTYRYKKEGGFPYTEYFDEYLRKGFDYLHKMYIGEVYIMLINGVPYESFSFEDYHANKNVYKTLGIEIYDEKDFCIRRYEF